MRAAVGLPLLMRAVGEVHGEARCGSLWLPHTFDMPPWEQPREEGAGGGRAFRRVQSEDGMRFILPTVGLWNSLPPVVFVVIL